MRLKGQHSRHSPTDLSTFYRSLNHRLMPEMESIENSHCEVQGIPNIRKLSDGRKTSHSFF